MLATAFARIAGVELLQVPYKGGAPSIQGLLAGDVDATFSDVATMAPALAQGALRLLAMVAGERSPLAPEVPTLREAGYEGVGNDPWYAVVAPAGTPAPVVDALASMLRETVRDEDLRRRVRALGYAMFDDAPAEFARALADEIARARAARAGRP